MNTETAIAEHVPPSAVPVKHIGDDLLLTADSSHDLQACQRALIVWCERKVSVEQANYEEIQSAYLEAKKNKWKHTTLQRHASLAAKRVEFYRKMKSALEHGYAIVPNFPVTAFAIRTSRSNPKVTINVTHGYRNSYHHPQYAETLREGEGEYQNPLPVVVGRSLQVSDGKGGTKTENQSWAEAWKDLEFPINMARLEVMQATNRAMALKIFDEIGVLPDPSRPRGDPVIIGRIVDPRDPKSWQNRRAISFMISWHLDTRTL